MANACDVIVVGAGVLGASVAWHCARRGMAVTVLEQNEPLAGTSGATFAWCGAHLKSPAAYNLHSQESIALYAGLERELEADLEYGRVGSISLLTAPEMEEFRARVGPMGQEGYALELLDTAQVRELEPAAPPAYAGGLHCPVDVEINPFKLVAAYLAAARRLGARLEYGREVTALTAAGGGPWEVTTPAATHRAPRVVLAGGIHTGVLGQLLGYPMPVRQSRGQILVTERAPKLLNGFVGLRRAPEQGGFMLRQVRAGNVMVGYTEEAVSFDRAVTPEGMGQVARNAVTGFPALGNLQMIRVYAGIRPMPLDGLPILSEIPGHPGVLLTVTHSGYTLSPWVGRAVAARLAGEETGGLFDTYGLARFAGAESGNWSADATGSFGGTSGA